MKNQKRKTMKILLIACFMAVLTVSHVQAAEDALLEMLPDSTLACVRINDFSTTLGKVDAYMTGASPIPVSLAMLANMQLAGIVGDPMMTGIDTGGDFCLVLLAQTNNPNPIGGVLVPMTHFDDFVEKNPNCTKDETGLAILASPNSPVGNLALMPMADGKYALALPQSFGTISEVHSLITAPGQSLQTRISSTQTQEAVTAPAWAYINTAALYAQYGQTVLDELGQAQTGMSAMTESGGMGQMGDIMNLYFKIYAEMFKTFAGDADSVTIALTPDAANLSLDVTLKAKDGSETAQMLAADPKAENAFSFTGYLDEANAVNGLMKKDQASLQKMYDKMFDIMDAANDEKADNEIMEKMRTITRKSIAAMGNEAAFSFSYSGDKPPFRITQVVAVDDMSSIEEIMEDSMSLAGDFYAEIGIPMKFDYQPETSTYKGATIDKIVILMPASDDPNDPMTAMFDQMYGGDLTYIFAHDNDKYYVAMGGDAENNVKKLIDKDASAPATGEVKAAFDLLQSGGYDDFVCSINIIKLLSGLGEMMENMASQMPSDCPSPMPQELFSGMSSVPTQSSLAMGGKTNDGQISIRTVLPKQHLVEVMGAVMQIQQKAMMQSMQPGMGQQ